MLLVLALNTPHMPNQLLLVASSGRSTVLICGGAAFKLRAVNGTRWCTTPYWLHPAHPGLGVISSVGVSSTGCPFPLLTFLSISCMTRHRQHGRQVCMAQHQLVSCAYGHQLHAITTCMHAWHLSASAPAGLR